MRALLAFRVIAHGTTSLTLQEDTENIIPWIREHLKFKGFLEVMYYWGVRVRDQGSSFSGMWPPSTEAVAIVKMGSTGRIAFIYREDIKNTRSNGFVFRTIELSECSVMDIWNILDHMFLLLERQPQRSSIRGLLRPLCPQARR